MSNTTPLLDTFGKLLQAKAALSGNRGVALRVKSHGIWKETGWQHYFDSVKCFALGIRQHGLLQGETVAIIGKSRPSSLYAIIGTQIAGGLPLHLHPDCSAKEVGRFIKNFKIRHMVAEDQEQVDKILECGDEADLLKSIIYCNPRGMGSYKESCLISFDRLLQSGSDSNAQLFDDLLTKGTGTDHALLAITSGYSGEPKGAVLSQRNIISSAASFCESAGIRETYNTVSLQPLSFSGEMMITLAAAVYKGFTVNFPEKQETQMADLREIGPDLILAPSDWWSSLAASVRARIAETTPFKRFMFNAFIKTGEAAVAPGLLSRIMLVRALRDRLGISRLKVAITTGATINNETVNFFRSTGTELRHLYAITEMSGAVCLTASGESSLESIGRALPGLEVKISPESEILLKGDGLFQGYFGESKAPIDADGWFHSGDSGSLSGDGRLTLTDRCDSIITLADGIKVAPQKIETHCTFSPFITNALVVSNCGKNLALLVGINGTATGKWASDKRIEFTGFASLASKSEVYNMIASELKKVNDTLPAREKISRFAILYKELHPDEAELTRMERVRRSVVQSHFSDIITAMEDGAEAVEVDKDIELGDGKIVPIRSRVLVYQLT